MREIVIISGKGGTGKTSVTAAFAALARPAMLVDCDVDAADLHLILAPATRKVHPFQGPPLPRILPDRCAGCGICQEACRFDAVRRAGDSYQIDPLACERCGVCLHLCPHGAIAEEEEVSGLWFYSETRTGPMVHAHLEPGAENSGKLVTVIKREARQLARSTGMETILVDGPPGIGCPVIAALSGADAAVIVTEPTVAGLHDLKRVAAVADRLRVPVMVLINKADLNPEYTAIVAECARSRGMRLLGELPCDRSVVQAQLAGLTVPEFTNGPVAQALERAWSHLDWAVPLRT